ncbi:MAG: hypothetical protein IPJ58_14110 [Ardenticatenia bacterium]|nr:hypothetical protein [Ardenticatenia bacterium]
MLYARRWDIEMAIQLVKQHLGVRLWWSSNLVVIERQLWATLIIAQVVMGLRLEIAGRAEVDIFDVSLPLLVQYLPRYAARGEDPVAAFVRDGRLAKIHSTISPPCDPDATHRPTRIVPTACIHLERVPNMPNVAVSRAPIRISWNRWANSAPLHPAAGGTAPRPPNYGSSSMRWELVGGGRPCSRGFDWIVIHLLHAGWVSDGMRSQGGRLDGEPGGGFLLATRSAKRLIHRVVSSWPARV